jgi:hypothetical protein
VNDERRQFWIFFWQKFVPLLALPVLGLFVAISPVVDGWSQTMWVIAAALVGSAIATYLFKAWLNSAVTLDEQGMTYIGGGKPVTWPHEKLINVKQAGKYRVRMCYDSGTPGLHMHITFDLFDADGFTDALLDWYASATGHELPEAEAA